MDSTQQRVLACEPHPGEPGAMDSLEVEIVEKQRSRLINSTVVYLVLGVVLGVLIVEPVRLVPIGLLGVAAMCQVWLRVLPGRALLAHPTILLTPGQGQLLMSGSTVSVALPGPEPQWVVMRLPKSKRLRLAGVRRMFVVGPDSRGRALVSLPGGINGRFGRIRTQPAPGSVEPVVQPRPLVAALRDPVVTTFLREVWQRSWWQAGLFVLLAAGIWATGEAYQDLPVASGFTTVLAVLYAMAGLVIPVRMATLSAAVKYQPWQELHATLDTPIQPRASGVCGTASGRVVLADGEVRVRFQRVPLDLLVNVRDTQRVGAGRAGAGPEDGRRPARVSGSRVGEPQVNCPGVVRVCPVPVRY